MSVASADAQRLLLVGFDSSPSQPARTGGVRSAAVELRVVGQFALGSFSMGVPPKDHACYHFIQAASQ